MIITFLIGNGFDIGLGMKTQFKDIYKTYIQTSSNAYHIEKFKLELQDDAPKYKNWSDFEMGMARYASNFSDEAKFIDCIRDFKMHMEEHLLSEQNKAMESIYKDELSMWRCVNELEKSMSIFYKGQSKNVIAVIDDMMSRNVMNVYNFIIFNYTTILDYIIARYSEQQQQKDRIEEVIHIHGKINEDVVLGVDNETQLSNVQFPISKKTQRAFIKPIFNQMYDKFRVEKAIKLIEESQVVCVYGMSLGESDKSWTDKLVEWLKEDPTHYLIYFDYTEEFYRRCNWDKIMEVEEEEKEILLKRITDSPEDIEKIINQVHIPIGYDIFVFDNIFKEA